MRFLDGKTCFSIKDHGQNIFTCPCISIKGSEVLINKTLKELSKMLFTALYSSTQLQYRLTQCNFFSSTHVFFFCYFTFILFNIGLNSLFWWFCCGFLLNKKTCHHWVGTWLFEKSFEFFIFQKIENEEKNANHFVTIRKTRRN